MKIIVDRFEGGYAVCEKEDLGKVSIEIKKLPDGVKEGDVLVIKGDYIKIDRVETENRRKRIQKLMNDLLE